MSARRPQTSPQPFASPIAPPPWALSLVDGGDVSVAYGCVVLSSLGVSLATTAVADALALDADSLRAVVADAYKRLFAAADARNTPHVVRAWNFVPDLLAPFGEAGDRYMSFNAGRHAAMVERFGDALPQQVPSASGVGHASRDLSIHLLALDVPGVAIENPRQTPAYRYSARYGAIPPCFARATRVALPAGERLLVAGTAAIRGETTRHVGDLAAQLAMTLDNLRAVAGSSDDTLGRFESLRAYVPPMADADVVRRSLPAGAEVVAVPALCRADLLVEIEGVARGGDANRKEANA